MWYLHVMILLCIIYFIRISYVFVLDKDPFHRVHKGDLEHLLWVYFISFCIICVWPLSVPVILVGLLREFIQGRKKPK